MDLETMEIVVRDLLSYRFPETVFCWQGGEPTLMGLDFFEKVVKTQMENGKGGQVVGNAFQTNGVLIDGDWADFLARYRFVVGLSLDGPRDVHDHYRKNLAGAGTFDKVMDAAELMRSRGVAFNILSVVNRVNQDQGRKVYRFLRSQGFDFIQFIPCLETDPDTGEVTEFSATPGGLGRFFEEIFDEYKRDGFPRVSERNLDALMNLHICGRPQMCTFDQQCGGYLVIEHNGDVYPCDFFVESRYRLGNARKRKLAEFFDHPVMKKFAAGKKKVPPDCGACPWFSWCVGGCQKDRLPDRAEGVGRTYFCESYKRLFDSTYKDMEKWTAPLKEEAERQAPPRTSGKIGRNDPCPCGSGKKYKKCCGAG